MKALSYLLGARALDVAMARDQRRLPKEPPFLPIASTPEAASAWRLWAAEGRAAASDQSDSATTAIRPATAKRRPAPSSPAGDTA